MSQKKSSNKKNEDKKNPEFSDNDSVSISGSEEAKEEKPGVELDDEESKDEDEISGEDLEENLDKDYAQIPGMDQYEAEPADNEIIPPILNEEKKEAEREIRRRELLRKPINKRIPEAMIDEEGSSEDEKLLEEIKKQRQAKMNTGEGFDQELNIGVDVEEVKGKLKDWLRKPTAKIYVKNSFKQFLKLYKDESSDIGIYEKKINEMCKNNRKSIELVYGHLAKTYPSVALWLAERPSDIVPLLNESLQEVVMQLFPQYDSVTKEVFVRIKDLPIEDSLRELRQIHLNCLIKIRGVITRRTGIYPQLQKMFFVCSKCGERKGPIIENTIENVQLGACAVCQSRGPFTLDQASTIYRNYQKIVIQETPGTVPPGRVPRQKEVILLNDLIDSARPGDEVEVTGIFINHIDYNLNARHGFPVFATYIEANNIQRITDIELSEITTEDRNKILSMAKDPNIGKKILESFAPSIYGYDFIKTALVLALFGGVPKDIDEKHRIRGDINILLVGDPGTGKSQFLKYLEKLASRCVYTTGKGASAVGLTASVKMDKITREWILEGGALVLADKGMCLIDEFDKMNEVDRTSIHEAMEQQTISISKAGIVTTLQARCSIIAAANPLKGIYDSQINFNQNVDLTEPILSRFDILSVIKDEIKPDYDLEVAKFVICSHIKSHQTNKSLFDLSILEREKKEPPISQEMLKKYLLFAKRFIIPKLHDINKEKINQFYTEIRKVSENTGGILITTRHLESILRIAEAHARMHLRETVISEDVDLAIGVMLESFIQSQKYSVAKAIQKRFSRYLVMNKDQDQLLSNILSKLIEEKLRIAEGIGRREDEVFVTHENFENEAKAYNMKIKDFLNSEIFKKNYIYQEKKIKRKTH